MPNRSPIPELCPYSDLEFDSGLEDLESEQHQREGIEYHMEHNTREDTMGSLVEVAKYQGEEEERDRRAPMPQMGQ